MKKFLQLDKQIGILTMRYTFNKTKENISKDTQIKDFGNILLQNVSNCIGLCSIVWKGTIGENENVPRELFEKFRALLPFLSKYVEKRPLIMCCVGEDEHESAHMPKNRKRSYSEPNIDLLLAEKNKTIETHLERIEELKKEVQDMKKEVQDMKTERQKESKELGQYQGVLMTLGVVGVVGVVGLGAIGAVATYLRKKK